MQERVCVRVRVSVHVRGHRCIIKRARRLGTSHREISEFSWLNGRSQSLVSTGLIDSWPGNRVELFRGALIINPFEFDSYAVGSISDVPRRTRWDLDSLIIIVLVAKSFARSTRVQIFPTRCYLPRNYQPLALERHLSRH